MRSLNSRKNRSPLSRFGGQSRLKAALVGVVVLAATLTVACGGGTSPTPGTPTAPTTPTQPGGSSSGTSWTLTQRFASVTGPDNCWVRKQRESLTGVGFSGLDMTVERSSGSITLKSQWFVEYVGTMNGSEFTAQQVKPLEGSGLVLAAKSATSVYRSDKFTFQ